VAGVVGVAGEDGEGSVDLFGENGAGEFVGKGDGAEREDESGAGAGGGGPAVGGADGEDDGLSAGVAEAAEVGGEGFGGEGGATAVEEDEVGGGAGSGAVEPGEEGGFGGLGERLAGEVAGGSGEVVGGESGGGMGFGAAGFWGDGGEVELHGTEDTKIGRWGIALCIFVFGSQCEGNVWLPPELEF
jgi:hypothetical protein